MSGPSAIVGVMDSSRLFIGFPTAGSIRPEFLASIVRVLRLAPDASVTYSMSSRLAHNRNELARQFLASGRDWMVTIDDDMVFDAEQVLTGLEVAESLKVKVMGALAFGDDGGQIFSTVMVRDPNSAGYLKAGNWPNHAFQRVDATGTALLAVHRDVMLDIQEQFSHRHPHEWFEEDIRDGMALGEDVTFCERVHAAGHETYVFTGIKTGHVKERILTENLWKRQQQFERFIVSGSADNVAQVRRFLNYQMIPVAPIGANPTGWRGLAIPDLDYPPPGFDNSALIDADDIMEAKGEDKVKLAMGACRLAGCIRPVDRVRNALEVLGMN